MNTPRNTFTPEQSLWLELLESGRFKQGKGQLRAGDAYCCFGVACEKVFDISPENGAETQKYGQLYYHRCKLYPPPEVWTALHLIDDQGTILGRFRSHFACGSDNASNLGQCNDSGMTFSDIAARIRKYPWAVFTNFDEPKEGV